MVILWAQCDKPRVLFSKNVVRGEKRKQLQRCLADLEYSSLTLNAMMIVY